MTPVGGYVERNKCVGLFNKMTNTGNARHLGGATHKHRCKHLTSINSAGLRMDPVREVVLYPHFTYKGTNSQKVSKLDSDTGHMGPVCALKD